MSALTVCIIRVWSRIMQWLIVMAAIIILSPAMSFAQLNGQNIKGDAGLKSGSQAPLGRMSRFRCTSTPSTSSKIATAHNPKPCRTTIK